MKKNPKVDLTKRKFFWAKTSFSQSKWVFKKLNPDLSSYFKYSERILVSADSLKVWWPWHVANSNYTIFCCAQPSSTNLLVRTTEKESVCDVAWGDKHYLRKSADCKHKISLVSGANAILICARNQQIFSGSVPHQLEQPLGSRTISLSVFGIKVAGYWRHGVFFF